MLQASSLYKSFKLLYSSSKSELPLSSAKIKALGIIIPYVSYLTLLVLTNSKALRTLKPKYMFLSAWHANLV